MSKITCNDWVKLKNLIQILERAGSNFRSIKDILEELLRLVEAHEGVESRQDNYESIKQELETCFQGLSESFSEPTRLKLTGCTKALCRDIKVEIARIRQYSAVQPTGEQERVINSDELQVHCRRIQELFQGLLLNTDPSTWVTPESSEDAQLSSLAVASGGYSSSAAREKYSCTFSAEVRQFRNWVQESPTGAVCWVLNERQTGISRLLCAELEATHKLAASYFLSPACFGLDPIIPSIALQLAKYSVPFGLAISSPPPRLCSEPLEVQFEELVVNPLTSVRAALPLDLAVVIDVTDQPMSARPIIDILLAKSKDLALKFFIFSRPEPYHDPNDHMFVHEVNEGCNIEGAEGEVKAALEPFGLSEPQITDLVQRTGALFACAAIAAHYISADILSNPSTPSDSART